MQRINIKKLGRAIMVTVGTILAVIVVLIVFVVLGYLIKLAAEIDERVAILFYGSLVFFFLVFVAYLFEV
jgi:hypothetical protein